MTPSKGSPCLIACVVRLGSGTYTMVINTERRCLTAVCKLHGGGRGPARVLLGRHERGVVEEHVFFDLTDRRFVPINSADQEVELAGHAFAKLADGRIEEVILTSIRPDGTTDALRYDAAKKAADIAEIGEIPYAVLASCGSRELFDRNDFGWFSVSLAKGLTTLPEAMRLLDFFRPYFVGEGTGIVAA